MNATELLGIAGFVLASVYMAFSFPISVKIATGLVYPPKTRLIYFSLGLLMYCLFAIYSFAYGAYFLAFAQILGALKYLIVLILLMLKKKTVNNSNTDAE